MSIRNYILDIFSYIFEKPLLTIEQYENLHMITSFSYKEIRRLRQCFLLITKGNEYITKEQFCEIDSIACNPLKDRICLVFGFNSTSIPNNNSNIPNNNTNIPNNSIYIPHNNNNIPNNTPNNIPSNIPLISSISFEQFMYSISLFNSIDRLEDKYQIAFQLQDFNNDGIISHSDLYAYIQLICSQQLTENEVNEIVLETMQECATDPTIGITPSNFQEVVSTTDFETKLHIYI